MVEQGAAPRVSNARRRVLKAAKALTTPLLPDDYIELMNPMWTTRELRGEIIDIRPETDDASTVVIRPSVKWLGHWPGQYLRIGVEINGRRHWRAYSLTSDPDHPDGLISVTIKHVAEGKLSPYFTRQAEIGSMVYLGGVEGEFKLPYPRPEKPALHQRRQRRHTDLEHAAEPRQRRRARATPSTSIAVATPTISSSDRPCATCTRSRTATTSTSTTAPRSTTGSSPRTSTSSSPIGRSARRSSPVPPRCSRT